MTWPAGLLNSSTAHGDSSRCTVQWKVQGGSPEGNLAWVRQKGCFGADDKVVLASTGREAYAGGGFHRVLQCQYTVTGDRCKRGAPACLMREKMGCAFSGGKRSPDQRVDDARSVVSLRLVVAVFCFSVTRRNVNLAKRAIGSLVAQEGRAKSTDVVLRRSR